MEQRFCNQCGSRLASSGGCSNVNCVAYVPPAAAPVVAAAALTAPPAAPDLFAEAPVQDAPTFPEPEIASPAEALERDWIAAGEAGQNEVYLGHRLVFQPPEATLNGSAEQGILTAMAIRFVTLGVLVFVFSIVVTVVFSLISGPKLGIILFFLINLAFFTVQILIPIRIPISEWMLLLDDKGAGAESAFAQITQAFRRRESPTAPTARRISFRGPGGIGAFSRETSGVRNYLAVKYGYVVGYISAFAFGKDLYIGWTLWWRQRPIRAFWNLLRQMLAAVLGRDVQFQLTLRADDAKALRELMHTAAREGVDVATRGLTVSLAGTVGADVPVEAFTPSFEE